MSEMSDMFKLVNAMELAKKARVGTSLTYFDVIELLGEINSLYEYIDELESARRWRVVADGELPETYRPVLTVDMSTATQVPVPAFYNPDTECWSTHFKYDLWVTHWMPLPQLPEERER